MLFGQKFITWTLFGHFLDIIWKHFVFGHILDTFWTYFGHILSKMCPRSVYTNIHMQQRNFATVKFCVKVKKVQEIVPNTIFCLSKSKGAIEMQMLQLLTDSWYIICIHSAHQSSQFANQPYIISGINCQVKVIVPGHYIADSPTAERPLKHRTCCLKPLNVVVPRLLL